MAKKQKNVTTACPCSGSSFEGCCKPYLDGDAVAPTALALMKSRYTAFCVGDESYLRYTWLKQNRPSGRIIDKKDMTKWVGLKIVSHQEEGDHATVEFVASYKRNGRLMRLHENSQFIREEDGCWYYIDGTFF